jgi:hypothetical protein
MMRRKILFCAVISLFFAACKKEINQEEVMAQAAKQYYTYLLQGNYEAWVDGFYRKDSIREAYRSQLIDNAKMFISQQKAVNGGIKSVDVRSTELDTVRQVANVFLTLNYENTGKEQVVMPMIYKNGLWYMR